jgi:tRNA (cmo5U34)-methyltransferase
VQRGTDVIDLGASRGVALQPFVDRFGSLNRFIAIEESGPMLDACRERFAGMIDGGVVQVREHDLAEGLPPFLRPSLTLAVLTQMFVPPECRQRLVADVYRSTVPGGAFILVEKSLGVSADFDRLLTDTFHGHKRGNGYTQEQIDAKRKSLRGVLMPLTAEANEAMLRAEGFHVQPFWRALNFAGWLAVKPKAGA